MYFSVCMSWEWHTASMFWFSLDRRSCSSWIWTAGGSGRWGFSLSDDFLSSDWWECCSLVWMGGHCIAQHNHVLRGRTEGGTAGLTFAPLFFVWTPPPAHVITAGLCYFIDPSSTQRRVIKEDVTLKFVQLFLFFFLSFELNLVMPFKDKSRFTCRSLISFL